MSNCKSCGQEVPDHEYQVFYCGGTFGSGVASQMRVVKAASHFDAVCDAGSYSEHGDGVCYLAIGPDPKRPVFKDEVIGRLYRLDREDDNPDFHTNTWACFGNGYTATEVSLKV